MKMKICSSASLLIPIFCIYSVLALPSSMLDEIKARELKPNKAKRVSAPVRNPDESFKSDNHNYDNPTAIKRGTPMQDTVDTDSASNNGDWTPEENAYQNTDNDFQSTLYNDENGQDWKDTNDYEKSYQYGISRDKLDEALENAVLKSELYGAGPTSLNQYRYLENEKRRRRKRDYNYGYHASTNDLTPEEVQALLNLYETEQNLNDLEQDSDTWLEVPVRPHMRYSDITKRRPLSSLDQPKHTSFRQNKWTENRNNHFMAARKRNDPTRELRYLNGPAKNDYYSLSQLLSNHRDLNVPVYHRYIL